MEQMNEQTERTGWCGRRRKMFLWIPIVVIAALTGFSFVVMLLWNAIIPSIFTTVGVISFWQALGLLVLSKILFGGFRGRPGGGGWKGRRSMYWKEKWMSMSEEEKAKFKDEWKNRCGNKC
jgi:hypothetical protein